MHHWYKSSKNAVTVSLLPLSWLFRFVVAIRRYAYRKKFKKSYEFSVPVIVVGNITVGGTGKTPFVIWLANFLKSQGFRPGIVSRGVGGKQQRAPRSVEKNSDPSCVGDESVLLYRKSDCPVVIGIDRVAAVKKLLTDTNCNIVISDDGLQHYRLNRDIEISIVDGERGLGNKKFLPAGPLRESPARLKEVDFVVNHISGSASKKRDNEFNMQLFGDKLVFVKDEEIKVSLNYFQNTKVHAVAALGNPSRFFTALRSKGLDIIEHVFPDHYLYQAEDFNFKDDLPIIMTEKDVVKCREFANERFWILPVEMQVEPDFVAKLMARLRKCEKFNFS